MSEELATANYEALVQFLYRAPIGLAQISRAGDVEMMNPTAAQLLMPYARQGSLDNLFDVLDDAAPSLRNLVAQAELHQDSVCDGLRLPPKPAAQNGPAGLAAHETDSAATVLSLSLMRLGNERLMALVADVGPQLRGEEQRVNRRLRAAALTDALTNMPNRAALLEHLVQTLAHRPNTANAVDSSVFALLVINCDRFRLVNDRLGNAVGDGLLGALAARLRATLRFGQSVAARVAGDEFAVLLQGMTDAEEAQVAGVRVVQTLGRPCEVAGHTLTCTVAIRSTKHRCQQ